MKQGAIWILAFGICGLTMTVLDLLNRATDELKAHGVENPRLNAELLLAHSMKLSREGLYIHLNDPVEGKEKEGLEKLIDRRISGEPLQYILGRQEFWSIDFKVDCRALIPRPETELLVEQALWVLSEKHSGGTPRVLEIGTGSGIIAISLARERKDVLVVASDISGDALFLAKENARSEGVLEQIKFIQGDLFGPFRFSRGKEPFDLILSNPPYIARTDIETLARETRDYEPMIALDAGEDGLLFYRSIVSQASLYLREGGWLLLEVGENQAGKVSDFIEKGGDFSKPGRLRDLSGIERVVKAQKTGPEIRSTKFASRNKFEGPKQKIQKREDVG